MVLVIGRDRDVLYRQALTAGQVAQVLPSCAWDLLDFVRCARTLLNSFAESRAARRSTSLFPVGSRLAWFPPGRSDGNGGMPSLTYSLDPRTQTGIATATRSINPSVTPGSAASEGHSRHERPARE